MVSGFWHLLLFVWDSGDVSGAFDLSLLVPVFLFCLLVLPLCRLWWVYDHTESVLLAVVIHASITGIVAMIVIPLDATGWPLDLVVPRVCGGSVACGHRPQHHPCSKASATTVAAKPSHSRRGSTVCTVEAANSPST